MAAMLRRGLGEDGYAVDVVGDGLEALWQATEVEYDAIVLDLMLPGADGFEVCRRLRQATGGRRCCCSPRAPTCVTGSPAWTAAPMTTWPSRSASASWPPGCGR